LKKRVRGDVPECFNIQIFCAKMALNSGNENRWLRAGKAAFAIKLSQFKERG
jgi:hypothetical protein